MFIDTEPHDVFISYAREDSDWVRQHLYEPLSACRTKEGRPARVFFDVGEHGIQVGQDFQTAIDQAIERTYKFLPVYSRYYFNKPMCRLELNMARQRDVSFSSQLLLPVLKDQEAIHSVPFGFKTLHWQTITDPAWFSKICNSLGLFYSTERLTLQFLDQPKDVFASHTLPRIRVLAGTFGQKSRYEELISIKAEQGQLLGTTTVKTVEGIATFDDLSITDPVGDTRLVARIPSSSESVVSEPFSVVARSRSTLQPQETPVTKLVSEFSEITKPLPNATSTQAEANQSPPTIIIPQEGRPLFFATGRHVLILDDQHATVYGVDGRCVGSRPLTIHGPPRLIRRKAGRLLLADWSGNLQIVNDDGSGLDITFAPGGRGFAIPADADLVGNETYIGFWEGSLYRISDQGKCELYLKDPAGIQVLGVYGERVFTCDFSGNLRTYRNRRHVNTVAIERLVWSLQDAAECLIAVGDRQFYHISFDGNRVLGFDIPIGNIQSVYELSALPVVMDTEGKGIRFNSNLVITSSILTQPGSQPVSADDAGDYCVLQNPDGTHTLQHRGRIVFSTSEGPLAISPLGKMFAMGEQQGIRIYTEREFLKLVESPTGQSPCMQAADTSSDTSRTANVT